MSETKTMIINMGPQHPSTHGVLRLVLELDGETVVKATPYIGYLHSGFEKEAESQQYYKFIPHTDRLDYLSPMMNNLGYVSAVEKLLQVEIPKRAQYIRVLMCELGRIASHLVWFGTHGLDMGAMTALFYAFREREKILYLYELVCGARMTVSYMRIGGVAKDLPDGYIDEVRKFINDFNKRINEYETLLTKNKIWMDRTVGVGIISAKDAIDLGLSGPSLRASGVKWDIRKSTPYSSYDEFDFDIPTRTDGDVYSRYLVRMEEMRQSARIVSQALDKIEKTPGPIKVDDPKICLPPREKIQTSMESLIHHFKLVTEGIKPPAGEAYFSLEAPKGELGFYVVSDGSNIPYRVRIRGPSFVNLQSLSKMVEGRLIADVTATIGSIDIVLGEVDR